MSKRREELRIKISGDLWCGKKTKKKEIKRLKFPIDLIEFPIKQSKEVKVNEEKTTLELYLKS